jgi:hypothetical protein
MARRTGSVTSITTAQPGLSDDLAMRTRRYLVTMGIRTVCFVAAIAVDHWTRWVFAVLAVFLPYLGVVGANAGREKGTFPALEPAHPSVAALPSASSVRSSRTTP